MTWKSQANAVIKPVLQALALCVVSLASNADDYTGQGETPYFSIILPENFQMTMREPVEDFQVYTISDRGRPYLYVYVGNAPSFPARTGLSPSDVSELDVPPLKILSEWRAGELAGRELLAHLSAPTGWPTALHAWTADLPRDALSTADKMLFSLKVRAVK
jgi:hypothetical protein